MSRCHETVTETLDTRQTGHRSLSTHLPSPHTGATLAVSVKARIRQVKADLKQAKVARAAAKASAIEAAAAAAASAAAARREQLNDESNARISQMYVTVGSLLPPPEHGP